MAGRGGFRLAVGRALAVCAGVEAVRYGLVVPVVWLYEAVLTPIGHGLRWVYRELLAPVGRGIAAAVGWVLTALFVWPVVGLWRYALVPLALAAAWLAEHLIVRPLAWAYRELLTPLGHGITWLLERLARGIAAVGSGLWAAVVWLVLTLLVAPLGQAVPAGPRPGRPGDRRRLRRRLAHRGVHLAGRRPGHRLAGVASDRGAGDLGLSHGVHAGGTFRTGCRLGPRQAGRRRGGTRGPGGAAHGARDRGPGTP